MYERIEKCEVNGKDWTFPPTPAHRAGCVGVDARKGAENSYV